MNLAMIILALKDSYLAQRPGKDKRTSGQKREAKQTMNDIISHGKINLRMIFMGRLGHYHIDSNSLENRKSYLIAQRKAENEVEQG